MLEAGFGKACINPPPGARLAGFAARQDVCKGIHDDLFARALVLRNGQQAVALVSVDLLALPEAFVRRVRAGIERRTGIPSNAVMIACTHTHAGPVTITTFFNPGESVNGGYMETLAGAIERSVEDAWRTLFPALAGAGSGRIQNLAVNRRARDGKPVDEEIGILRVADASGATRGVWINYSCHPTVLGPDNLLATGDYPAATIARVESALGPGSFAMFANGTEGDVSVGHSSELSAIGVIAPGRTFERAAELGERLADSVLAAAGGIAVGPEAELGAASSTLALPVKDYPAPEDAARALEQAERRVASLDRAEAGYRAAKSELLYASITNFYAGETRQLNGALPIELQALRVGDTAVLGIPAEVFVGIGLRIKREAPLRTFIAGLANGYIGYFPDRSSYPAGGYEVVSAKIRETSEDLLVEAALELERRL